MYNDKTAVEGVHKNLPDCYPIWFVNDSHFM